MIALREAATHSNSEMFVRTHSCWSGCSLRIGEISLHVVLFFSAVLPDSAAINIRGSRRKSPIHWEDRRLRCDVKIPKRCAPV